MPCMPTALFHKNVGVYSPERAVLGGKAEASSCFGHQPSGSGQTPLAFGMLYNVWHHGPLPWVALPWMGYLIGSGTIPISSPP